MRAKKKKSKNLSKEEQHPIRKALSDILAEGEESALMADGFEDAIVGLSLAQPGRPTLVVYDYEKCVRVLTKRDGMSREDAEEFLSFNTVGAWLGDSTPVFVNTVKAIFSQQGLDMPKKAKKKVYVDPRQLKLV